MRRPRFHIPRSRYATLAKQYQELWFEYEGLRWRWEILTKGKQFDPGSFDVVVETSREKTTTQRITPKMPEKVDLPGISRWDPLGWE